MKNIFCWLIVLIHLQIILPAIVCEETRDVFGINGEEVTLQVSVVQGKDIRQIRWVTFDGVNIATSRPGGFVEIREDYYADRLRATSDGSLIIEDLKMEDGGIIKATIYLLDGEDCSETYNLSVTGKCGMAKKVSVPVGGNVTLQVEESHINNLFWERPVGVIIGRTNPGGFLDLREEKYKGRLQGSPDGSLTLRNVSGQDQGYYRAVIFPPDGVACARVYDVSISVLPAKVCEETRDVFGVYGEEVTLQVSVVQGKDIRQIRWVTFDGVNIATSRPGGFVEIREDYYADRLRATSDGSLIIKDLKMEDGGIIKATIYLLDGEDCSEAYNLSVTGKCGTTKNVSAPLGGNVTLQVEESHISNLFWERPVGVIIATTKPGGFLDLRQDHYNGRLQGSPDGSLTIRKVSAQDQGDYRAVIFATAGVACARMYDVSISTSSTYIFLQRHLKLHKVPAFCSEILKILVFAMLDGEVTLQMSAVQTEQILQIRCRGSPQKKEPAGQKVVISRTQKTDEDVFSGRQEEF
ncbi:uncharacterized protein RB166_013817 [Leptodactylus fuscus]|uniref:uncharacterized protein LOC142213435 n=1 Tax=Leptodactylus fuscus TaxID=238119 RepID=UPI003F4F25F6